MKIEHLNAVGYDYICGLDEQDTSGRCSDNYHIFYVNSGCGTMRIEGADIPFSEGDFCLVHPLAFYRISAENDKDLQRYAFSFPKEKIDGALLDFLDSLFQNGSPCAVIRGITTDSVQNILSTLSFADKLDGDVKQQYIFAIISQLLAIISSSSKRKRIPAPRSLFIRLQILFLITLREIKPFPLTKLQKPSSSASFIFAANSKNITEYLFTPI